MFYQLGCTRRSLLCAASCSYACSSIVQFSHAIMFLRFLAFPAEQRAAAYRGLGSFQSARSTYRINSGSTPHHRACNMQQRHHTSHTIFNRGPHRAVLPRFTHGARLATPIQHTLQQSGAIVTVSSAAAFMPARCAPLWHLLLRRGHHGTQTSSRRAPNSMRS